MRRLKVLVLVVTFGMFAVPTGAQSVSGEFVDDDGVPGELHIERLAELGAIHGCNPPHNTWSCPNRD